MKDKRRSLRKKTRSKIQSKQNHTQKIGTIKKEHEKVSILQKELQSIEKKIKHYSNDHSMLTPKELEIKLSLIDKKKTLTQTIDTKRDFSSLHEYLLDNVEDLFSIRTHKTTTQKIELKSNNVLQYFNNTKDTSLDKQIFNNKDFNNDNNNIKNVCYDCNREKILYQTDGIMVCPGCGIQEKVLISINKPSYKQPPREMSYFAYKRINHFNEWLAQFQAKETTDIPKDVYDRIIEEIKKESYISIDNISISKLRSILKKLKLNKYYEHVPHIINRLTGTPAPIITREIEIKLRSMFKEIQNPWMKYCPNNRSNFLSYSYVLYKCLQLLEMDEYLEYFSLLKSREKLAEQDKIWKCICKDLRWEYIKTI